jgi:hypothetical protein
MSVGFAIENLRDTNYRMHGSGCDAAGINFYVTLNMLF